MAVNVFSKQISIHMNVSVLQAGEEKNVNSKTIVRQIRVKMALNVNQREIRLNANVLKVLKEFNALKTSTNALNWRLMSAVLTVCVWIQWDPLNAIVIKDLLVLNANKDIFLVLNPMSVLMAVNVFLTSIRFPIRVCVPSDSLVIPANIISTTAAEIFVKMAVNVETESIPTRVNVLSNGQVPIVRVMWTNARNGHMCVKMARLASIR
jgi:hypothetical protein